MLREQWRRTLPLSYLQVALARAVRIVPLPPRRPTPDLTEKEATLSKHILAQVHWGRVTARVSL